MVPDHGAGVLRDLTVLDFTQQLPGPFATALLKSLGARVIKIEPPQGDPSRTLDPEMFDRVNAGKESVTLDLKSESGRTAALGLVQGSDVVVESFRPGVMARLGVDWTACQAVNSRLVYCSISGFGADGPYAHVPVHDLNLMAWGDPSGAHRTSGHIGVPWVDLGTGTTAALTIVAAWVRARDFGVGAKLDVSMLELALSWSRVKPPRSGMEPTYGVYRTCDDHEVVIAVLEDHFWSRLCTALELGDLGQDPALADYSGRVIRAEELHGRVSARIAQLQLSEILSLAQVHDLPITTAHAQADDRAVAQLALAGFGDGGFRLPTRETGHAVGRAPEPGEHTALIMAEFAAFLGPV
jgi:crotonobetainyl-CoA:carnitine CoA-transferase CaiB-like acyl-CoA transferase